MPLHKSETKTRNRDNQRRDYCARQRQPPRQGRHDWTVFRFVFVGVM